MQQFINELRGYASEPSETRLLDILGYVPVEGDDAVFVVYKYSFSGGAG